MIMGMFAERFAKFLKRVEGSRKLQAEALGMSVSQLSNMLAGRQLPTDRSLYGICRGLKLNDQERAEFVHLVLLERAKGITREHLRRLEATVLMGAATRKVAAPTRKAEAPAEAPAEKTPRVPVVSLSAGKGVDFGEEGRPVGVSEGYVSVPGLDDPQGFACRVPDDSMAPTFQKGDIVIFRPSESVKSGDFCFVRSEEEAVFRQVFFEGEELGKAEEVRLAPVNREYPDRHVKREDVMGLWRLFGTFRKWGE